MVSIMTRVHPNAPEIESTRQAALGWSPATGVEALTVWRKSLLLNGNGFAVFDAKGNLVFRVDNYASGNKGEIVLMDVAGKSLLTIRRKKLSLGEHWLIYDGDESAKARFSVKKHSNFIQPKTLARVTPCDGDSNSSSSSIYDIEGSYSKRSCMVYGDRRRPLAEIRRKETVAGVLFDADVFRLIIYPGLEAPVAMAIVMLLEQMFGSRGSFKG